MQSDSLLLKELFKGRFSDDRVVCQSVQRDPALHICSIIVSGEDLLLREVILDPLKQLFIRLCIEKNEALGEDILANFVVIPGFFLALLEGLLFFDNFFSGLFIEFLFLDQEYFSCLSICTRESIKYVSSIPAIILS